jgi:uncharacterized protein YbdZ (MbtH family)
LQKKAHSVTNPFEDDNGEFHVLRNEEGQYSLWPTSLAIPVGWHVVHHSDNRASCLQYVADHWKDLRPQSLIERMNQAKPSALRQ